MFTINRLSSYQQPLDAADAAHLGPQAALDAQQILSLCPKHGPTPLRSLPGLARRFGVAQLLVKDESERFGMGSFKALGGAYAALRVFLREVSMRLSRPVQPSEIGSTELRTMAENVVFTCATAGNHGRSVAAGARFLGCRAVIFLHQGVSPARARAIEQFGATVRYVAGSYDDSVAECTRVAAENGWQIISDTSWPGYEAIPRLVEQGYTVLLREVQQALTSPPTHVFVQAGVGGIAASAAAYFSLAYGARRPRMIVVEPERAACVYHSHQAGLPIAIRQGEPTTMSMLECYEPSRVAWQVLSRWADAFMTVTEDAAIEAMRLFAAPVGSDDIVISGASGAAGFAGFITAMSSAAASELDLNSSSRVLLLNTEGATDLGLYAQLVGAADALRTQSNTQKASASGAGSRNETVHRLGGRQPRARQLYSHRTR